MAGDELASIVRRFAESECSWLSTVRPDGRAHAAPIWHVWHRGRVYVVVMTTSVKARNIASNPDVVITHPDPVEAIIVEGRAQLVEGMTAVLRPHFERKYDWDIATDEEYDAVVEITPTRLLAWGEEGSDERRRWTREDLSAAGLDDSPAKNFGTRRSER
jgi:nitroimidazol reductase NimA-like FMN-containing flavoprotein (pyridoxamine 5'-phosphate oxidase superfamily)